MHVPKAVIYLASSEGRTRLLELIFKQTGRFTTDDLLSQMNQLQPPLSRTVVTTVLRVLVTKRLLVEEVIFDEPRKRGRRRSVFQLASTESKR